MIAVIAEKPSMARDIAAALGARRKEKGFFQGNGYLVCWAIGHLVRLPEPAEIEPCWKSWRMEHLPMLPRKWPLVVMEATRDQFRILNRILHRGDVASLICACDAGREGELIFRHIYEASGCQKPWQRLWISSLTREAILKGFGQLRSASSMDDLASAAVARARADWLVGMNLSRYYSLQCDDRFSVGRVQTPTLAMLVEREMAIREFVPELYCILIADMCMAGSSPPHEDAHFEALWCGQGDQPHVEGEGAKRVPKAVRLKRDDPEIPHIIERILQGDAHIHAREESTHRQPPPLFHDLADLQREANRVLGLKARETLESAQSLYEKHKLITYPRTDSRHLTRDMADSLPRIAEAVEGPYLNLLPSNRARAPLSHRYIDDSMVTDHHAIIPTGVDPRSCRMSQRESHVFDLVCRRFLCAWLEDHIHHRTRLLIRVDASQDARIPPHDWLLAQGRRISQIGWKKLSPQEPQKESLLPSSAQQGAACTVADLRKEDRQTQPPKRYTDASLLTAMESAGKALEDRQLSAAMKERGLGTPATRAAILETLIQREYVMRQGKALAATDRGIRLIQQVHSLIKSPEMTGQWEYRLKKMEKGQVMLDDFIQDIEALLRDIIGHKVSASPQEVANPPSRPQEEPRISNPRQSRGQSPEPRGKNDGFTSDPAPRVHAPSTIAGAPDPRLLGNGDLKEILQTRFGFQAFRPYQEHVCQEVAEGRDALLVMPTGAGKSLCYQLPGLARTGTTLVVSPLIALMEDQSAKLRQMGFRAHAIHSGRPREAARDSCRAYLSGALDFLFIAPERLSVPRFPEMLARRKPCLIAVDEAHCISHWGHDFRPDYRLLGSRLPQLRPAPVIAMTATATRRVQEDIVAQLGLEECNRFIHGFRRDNIAIEMLELPQPARDDKTLEILTPRDRRPAIVYTPTRKKCEALAERLSEVFPTTAYHAGMTPTARDHAQTAFVEESVDVVVATIAFGMGIDKPNIRTVIHTAMPGTMEGYYQEIGRAGRDGLPSRAILLHGYADVRLQQFFLEKNYPPASMLMTIFNRLSDRLQPRSDLLKQTGLDPDVFDAALEKLWVHDGCLVEHGDSYARGGTQWMESYRAQRAYREAQLEEMIGFLRSTKCRMVCLIQHFGDQDDSGRPCGLCDQCSPDNRQAVTTRIATAEEQNLMRAIFETLGHGLQISTGQLFKQLIHGNTITRTHFESMLEAMARADLIQLYDASFEKGGKTIHFRKASPVPNAWTHQSSLVEQLKQIQVDHSPDPPPKKRDRKPRKAKKTSRSTARDTRNAGPQPGPSPGASVDPPFDQALEEALITWRLELARKRRIPAFRIVSNRSIRELATHKPRDMEELLTIHGIGKSTASRHGQAMLDIIRDHP